MEDSRVLFAEYFVFCAAWARDEPPSPTDPEHHDFLSAPSHESLRRPSDVASYQSSDPGPSRWWIFTLPRPQRTNTLERDALAELKHDLRGNLLKDRPTPKRSGSGDTTTLRASEPKENGRNGWGLQVDLPRTPRPFTLSHTQTPGWDTPWSARLPSSVARANGNGDAYNELGMEEEHHPEDDKQTPWKQRKKMLRGFLLTNSYVPLVSTPLHISIENLKWLASPAVPLREHHLHHLCVGHRDTNTSLGEEPSR